MVADDSAAHGEAEVAAAQQAQLEAVGVEHAVNVVRAAPSADIHRITSSSSAPISQSARSRIVDPLTLAVAALLLAALAVGVGSIAFVRRTGAKEKADA